MNTNNSTEAATTGIGDSTETARKAVEDYQDAIVRLNVRSTLGEIHKVAARHGWDTVQLLSDVWHEMYDGDFKPWLAQPVFVPIKAH